MSTTQSAATVEAEAITGKPSFGDIPIQCIRASLTNPRKTFDPVHLAALSENIKKMGIAQPILVRPRETDAEGVTFFEIVAGERRYRASKLAGMPTVPAIVRVLTDIEALEIQVIENLQRQDLHPLEEAEGFEVLMKEAKLTVDQLATKVNKSRAYIYASLKLCALAEAPRKAFYDGDLNKSTALLVARIPVKALQMKCVKDIGGAERGMSHRAAAAHIERNYMSNLKKADFKVADASLLPSAGACGDCPKRAGNQPEIFTDVGADVCTDPTCFKAKTDAHVIRIKKVAIESGKTVIVGANAKKIMPHSGSWSSLKDGYARLDDSCNTDPKRRTYRQLLGKDKTQVALLENPHEANMVEVVKVADIKPLLVAQGITSSRETSPGREKEKAQEELAKQEIEYRERLFDQVHHASLMMSLVDHDLRMIACRLLVELPGGTKQKAKVYKLMGWADDKFGYQDLRQNQREAIEKLTPAELNQFIRACSLSYDLNVYSYTGTSKDEPINLVAAAGRVNIDAKAIKAEVKKEAKDKADLKKAAAAKKAAKLTKAGAAITQPAGETKAEKAVAKPAVKAKAKPATKKHQPAKASDVKTVPAPSKTDAEVACPKVKAPAEAWPFPTKSVPTEKPAQAGDDLISEAMKNGTAAWPFPTSSRPK